MYTASCYFFLVHSSLGKLTVGARGLSKHQHRDEFKLVGKDYSLEVSLCVCVDELLDMCYCSMNDLTKHQVILVV